MNENNAAQPVLTDEEINAACDWPGSNTTMRAENDRAMAREVEAAVLRKLSKLRAPVAGEAREHIEQRAVNRYRPVPDGKLSYKVVAGDGTRSLYTGTKDSCLRVAAKLTEAFLDGAFVASDAAPQASAEPAQPCSCPSGDGSLRHPCAVHPADRQQRAGGADVGRLLTAAKGMTKLYGHVWDRADGALVVFPENVARFDVAFDALRTAVGEVVDDATQPEQGERE